MKIKKTVNNRKLSQCPNRKNDELRIEWIYGLEKKKERNNGKLKIREEKKLKSKVIS